MFGSAPPEKLRHLQKHTERHYAVHSAEFPLGLHEAREAVYSNEPFQHRVSSQNQYAYNFSINFGVRKPIESERSNGVSRIRSTSPPGRENFAGEHAMVPPEPGEPAQR
ncbi:hypothetical protein [Paraburkholderia sp. SIMBA_030]|uniref:hypothetical protein n=1 Tax=Paraburkholderia sp. SIMBA_030 TaxID=3085773 RepID=UPI00397D562A